MRRSLSLRIATIVLIAMTSTPLFAAGRGWDDSPVGRAERIISRLVQGIKNLPITILDNLQGPK